MTGHKGASPGEARRHRLRRGQSSGRVLSVKALIARGTHDCPTEEERLALLRAADATWPHKEIDRALVAADLTYAGYVEASHILARTRDAAYHGWVEHTRAVAIRKGRELARMRDVLAAHYETYLPGQAARFRAEVAEIAKGLAIYLHVANREFLKAFRRPPARAPRVDPKLRRSR